MGERRNNVFLIGPRGSGKTTVACLLAERLGWTYTDADVLLESRCGRSIRQVFADEGETGFRQHETRVLEEICQGSRQVAACGGGVVLRPENRARLVAAGRVVWLNADAATLWQRQRSDATTRDRRPALTAAGGLAEVEELLRTREPLYRGCAELRVETAGREPSEIADLILAHLRDLTTPK